eukprot:g1901.t1
MGRSLHIFLTFVAGAAVTVFVVNLRYSRANGILGGSPSFRRGLQGSPGDGAAGGAASTPLFYDTPGAAMLEAFRRNTSDAADALQEARADLAKAREELRATKKKLASADAARQTAERKHELLDLPPSTETEEQHLPDLLKDMRMPPLLSDPPEGEVDLAFHLQIHAGSLAFLPRVMRAIWHPRNTYAVHFDQGSLVKPELVGALLRHLRSNYDNIFVMNAETITYGGITIVLNTLSSMSALLRVPRRWDYWINLSGNDYPIVSPTHLRRTLARHGGGGGGGGSGGGAGVRGGGKRREQHEHNFVEFNLKHGYPTKPKDLTRQQRFYYGWFDTALVKTAPTVAQSEIDQTVAADSVCLAQWAWELTTMSLNCPNNKTITEIKLASFGRPYGDVCTDDPQSTIVRNCHAETAQLQVERRCLGKNSCEMGATNDQFGKDPCPGFTKWLAVAVQCTKNEPDGTLPPLKRTATAPTTTTTSTTAAPRPPAAKTKSPAARTGAAAAAAAAAAVTAAAEKEEKEDEDEEDDGNGDGDGDRVGGGQAPAATPAKIPKAAQTRRKLLEVVGAPVVPGGGFGPAAHDHHRPWRRRILGEDGGKDGQKSAAPKLTTKVLQSKREYIKRIGHNPMIQYRDFHIVKTEFWMILSRKFCHYLLHEQYPRRMLSYFSTTFIPDEHYIGTVLWNSPRWRKTLVPTAFHTVNWRIGRIRPSTLTTSDDLTMLRRSRNLFARK